MTTKVVVIVHQLMVLFKSKPLSDFLRNASEINDGPI